MDAGWNLLWFIVGVSLLVTVHEFGHFWVARKLGFKVLRFSVGFGKPLFKKIGAAPDHTEYVIAALPLGGYVRMLDERDGEVPAADMPRAFGSKAPWKRILVMLAGPGANFIFAILVLWGLFAILGIAHVKAQVSEVVIGRPAALAGLRAGDEVRSINGTAVLDQGDANLWLLDAVSDEGKAELEVLGRDGVERSVTIFVADPVERRRLTEPNQLYDGLGFRFWAPSVPAVLGEVTPGGPAAAVDLRPGDLITAIDGAPVRSFNEVGDYINARPDQSVLLAVTRGVDKFTRRVQTVRDTDQNGRVIGRIKIAPAKDARVIIPPDMITRTAPNPVAALGESFHQAWTMTAAQAKFFMRMLTGKLSFKNLSSPIGIAGFAGDSARAGPEAFLMYLVLISLSLGFLNLLPIPILDGGQVVFAVAEWFNGRPLSERAQALGWHAGLIMLALLMGVAVFNDLAARFAHS